MASFGPIGSAACNRCEYSPKPKRKPWIPAEWQLGRGAGRGTTGSTPSPPGGAAVRRQFRFPPVAVRGSRFAVRAQAGAAREDRLSLRGGFGEPAARDARAHHRRPADRRHPQLTPWQRPVTCRSPVGHPPPIVAICLILVPKYRTPAQFHAAPAHNDQWRSLEVATGWPWRPATSWPSRPAETRTGQLQRPTSVGLTCSSTTSRVITHRATSLRLGVSYITESRTSSAVQDCDESEVLVQVLVQVHDTSGKRSIVSAQAAPHRRAGPTDTIATSPCCA